jgi:hypothetical protein
VENMGQGGNLMRLCGTILLLLGSAGFALAGNPSPEIDPSSGAAAIALLSGGLIVLRARRKK